MSIAWARVLSWLDLLGQWAAGRALVKNPWAVYGIARSLIATATLLTLAINDTDTLFRPGSGIPEPVSCPTGVTSYFCLFPAQSFELARWLAVGVLAVVVTGWRPQITALPHWWITYSFFVSARPIDGGDQLAAVLTLILLPAALSDRRRWHWPGFSSHGAGLRPRLVAASALTVARVQVAVVYFNAAVAKMGVQEWVDGTALYYYLLTISSFRAPDYLYPILEAVLSSNMVAVLTWGALGLELALASALFLPQPARNILFVLGCLFHLLILIIQGIASFSIVMFGALALYLLPVPLSQTSAASASRPEVAR